MSSLGMGCVLGRRASVTGSEENRERIAFLHLCHWVVAQLVEAGPISV